MPLAHPEYFYLFGAPVLFLFGAILYQATKPPRPRRDSWDIFQDIPIRSPSIRFRASDDDIELDALPTLPPPVAVRSNVSREEGGEDLRRALSGRQRLEEGVMWR
ncbi:hypothetical protein PENSPDRAFT_695461 [Peniophora sp. CONT]|nr:hypothetical protein PENSPDRAFT_695461 [Peniophora sp. CONT]